MTIDFDEQYHAYAVDGDIADISVTELLHKHKLAPSYKGVPSEVLANAAERGKAIHKDIELFVNNGQPPKTPQGELFREYFNLKIENGFAERPIAIKFNEKTICGTADLICKLKDGTFAIYDHKCTSSLNRTYVAWQTSLLDYMFRANNKNYVNGIQIDWKGADKLYVNHFDKEGNMVVNELDRIPDKEIEKLLLAESQGELYEPKELILDSSFEKGILECENKAYELEQKFKAIEEEKDKWRTVLKEAMEAQGIKKWTSSDGLLTVTYVPESQSIGIDTKKIKEEYPNIAIKCQKKTKKKAYIKVTRRDSNEI